MLYRCMAVHRRRPARLAAKTVAGAAGSKPDPPPTRGRCTGGLGREGRGLGMVVMRGTMRRMRMRRTRTLTPRRLTRAGAGNHRRQGAAPAAAEQVGGGCEWGGGDQGVEGEGGGPCKARAGVRWVQGGGRKAGAGREGKEREGEEKGGKSTGQECGL